MPIVTIVTLEDRDGDEFPIALPGQGYNDVAAYRNAIVEAQKLISEGKWRPNGLLTLKHVKDPADER